MEQEHKTDCMIRAMNIVRECGGYTDDHEYMKIYSLIGAYLKKHCQHEWVKDTIDIREDYSRIIFYCQKCYTTES